MSDAADATLVATLARFCRALRADGVLVTPGHTSEAARALLAVDVGDRDDVYLALRSVLLSRPEDAARFDELFLRFWAAPSAGGRGVAPVVARSAPPAAPAAPMAIERWLAAADDQEADDRAGIARASPRESLGTRDFRTFDDAQLPELARLARRMARRLAARPSRRWRPSPRGTRVHLRHTIRLALGTGGTPLRLALRRRKPRRTRLVVLADVSGSMDLYSRFLLQFLYALQSSFARVETFVFATRLSRITEPLGAPRYAAALERMAAHVRDWSGGTRIGECLAAFEREWGTLVDRRTVVVILSDGWDTGDPAELGDALARVRRRAGRVIWLNPLLGSPGYEPLTRGMQAALPHVDVFHPAHDLASLESLVRHLTL